MVERPTYTSRGKEQTSKIPFDNQKINFKRNENILDISWECNEEITEVRLNKDNVEEMISHYIHDWHCG